MIPKIIHYIWLSNEPIPLHIQELMKTWKEKLPDYKFILWDGKKLAEINNTFANEAASVSKWAFASDYIRCYAIYHYGGIYLDTDIEVFKSFDIFLNNRMFISREFRCHETPPKRYLTAHVFGAEKNHPFLKDCIDYYNKRHFILSDDVKYPECMRYDMTILPKIQAYIAIAKYGYNANGYYDKEQIIKEGIHIYPSYYFDSPQYHSMNTVFSIHRIQLSWKNSEHINGIDKSITDAKKKGVVWLFKTLFNKINLFLGKYLNYQIVKIPNNSIK